MEFTQELQDAYQQSGYQTEFYWEERSRTGLSEADRLHCQQRADELGEELARELGSDKLEDRIFDDEHIQYLAGERDANTYALEFDDKYKEREQAVRSVINDVADGLTVRSDFQFVSYARFSGSGEGNELDGMPSMLPVPDFVARHPVTESRGSEFAAQVSWRLAHFLTPQVVEQITADKTRVMPMFINMGAEKE